MEKTDPAHGSVPAYHRYKIKTRNLMLSEEQIKVKVGQFIFDLIYSCRERFQVRWNKKSQEFLLQEIRGSLVVL